MPSPTAEPVGCNFMPLSQNMSGLLTALIELAEAAGVKLVTIGLVNEGELVAENDSYVDVKRKDSEAITVKLSDSGIEDCVILTESVFDEIAAVL